MGRAWVTKGRKAGRAHQKCNFPLYHSGGRGDRLFPFLLFISFIYFLYLFPLFISFVYFLCLFFPFLRLAVYGKEKGARYLD